MGQERGGREYPPQYGLSSFDENMQYSYSPKLSGITEGLLTEYRSIRCLNYVKFLGNTDYDFP